MLELLWDIITLPLAIIGLVATGAVVGLLARWLLPGRDDLSFVGTVGLGIAGSLVAGVVGALLGGNVDDRLLFIPRAGFFWSIVGAVVALLAHRVVENSRR
ncbi:MAG: GlsB/YeaQ/YmgE family stress response membrane protein [Acidimicrobiia bacterium]